MDSDPEIDDHANTEQHEEAHNQLATSIIEDLDVVVCCDFVGGDVLAFDGFLVGYGSNALHKALLAFWFVLESSQQCARSRCWLAQVLTSPLHLGACQFNLSVEEEDR